MARSRNRRFALISVSAALVCVTGRGREGGMEMMRSATALLRTRDRRLGSLGVTLLLLTGALPVHGAVFNVDTAAELQSALTTAQSNGQADTINLAAGTYSTTDNGGNPFLYTATHTETFSLTLDGAGIGVTILDGADTDAVLGINLEVFRQLLGDPTPPPAVTASDDGSTITIQDMTVQNGASALEFCRIAPATCSDGVAGNNTGDAGVTVGACA